ncbi:MAG: sulfotransferase [Marmoricola sp.]
MIRHLLVIGAQRCGTTYLSSLLDEHPEITMARPSRPEPKVFCSAEASGRGAGWYRETYFRHADTERLLGDKSTSYLECDGAASRAAAVLGEAHVVAVLRDPVERAVSNWRFSTQHGLETRPLEAALRDNLAGPAPWDPGMSSVSPFAYLERGRYMDHLPAWTAAFPKTTHVVFLRELIEDDAVLECLWERLDVDPGAAPRRSRDVVNENDGDPPALSSELSGTLRSYFEASDRALSAHVGRPLPW